MSEELRPVHELILVGFNQAINEHFGIKAAYVNSTDEMAVLQKIAGDQQIEYPLCVIKITNFQESTDSYSGRALRFKGIPVKVNDSLNQVISVRLFPVDIQCEVKFITNKFEGKESDSILSLVRKWLIAKSRNNIVFKVKYGRLWISITASLEGSLSAPVREAVTENESVYAMTGNATIKGYTSDTHTQGFVDEVAMLEGLELVNSLTGKGQFIPFPGATDDDQSN